MAGLIIAISLLLAAILATMMIADVRSGKATWGKGDDRGGGD